jgi:DNA modification methylase
MLTADAGERVKNELNDLSGSEWLYFTNTIWETNYPPDSSHRLRKLHGAMKPPEVMRDLVLFFTRANEFVLDPFAGVGGTLLGAELAGRKSLGFELNPKWVEIYQEIKRNFVIRDGKLIPRKTEGRSLAAGFSPRDSKAAGFIPAGRSPGLQSGGSNGSTTPEGVVKGRRQKAKDTSEKRVTPIKADMVEGDCLELIKTVKSESVDAIICDPPYGVAHKASGFKDETNFAMYNVDDQRDFGNARTNEEFLDRMGQLACEAFRVLKPGRYFVLMVGDRYQAGEYLPLGANLANALRAEGFELKGIKIWFNRATQRPLKPYALKRCFVPNITHQNIVIMRRSKR